MAQASIQVEADLRSATEQFVQFARRVRDTEGGLKALTGAAGKAATEIEKTGKAHKDSGEKAGKHSQAVESLVSHFTSIVTISAGVYKAIQFIGEAHQEAADRAQQAAEANRALLRTQQELAGASNYSLKGTTRNRELAARLGVETKTDFQTALAATGKGLQEGYGPDDIRAALQFQRVSGTDPNAFFEVAGKALDSGRRISGAELANLLISLQDPKHSVGAAPAETLQLADKLIGGGAELGYSPAQVIGLAANISQTLDKKKTVPAIDTVLQALASSVEVKGTATAEQIALAQKTGVGPGQLGKTPVKLTGTALERLAQLQTLDPTKYRALTEDAQTGIVVNAIRGGALTPLATGDLLGAAVRAADADTYRQGTDLQNQASSATALTEAQQGNKWQRIAAKRQLLIAAMQQAGYGAIATKWASGTMQSWIQFFGGLDALEGKLDDDAANFGVTLDPNRVVRGQGGATIHNANGTFTTPDQERTFRRNAQRVAWRTYGGDMPRREAGWTSDSSDPNWQHIYDQSLREQRGAAAEAETRRREEEAAQMREQTSAIHSQTEVLRQAIERKGPNGSLRDWRGDDLAVRTPRGFPDMSGRRYFG